MTSSRPSQPFPLPAHPLRIATAQAPVVRGAVEANAAQAAALIERAAADGVRLVLFAEKFLTGYEPELIASDPARYTVTEDDPRLAPIAAACRAGGTAAVVGAATRDAAGVLRISALVFGPDGVLAARYDKQHQFGSEPEVFAAGTAGCTVELAGWQLGLGVCYDSGFPEHARTAALDGCHAYLVGALFSRGGGRQQVDTWFPARAIDNTVYVLLANHIGHTGGMDTCGHSAGWGPDGRLLSALGETETGLAVVDLDPARLREVREDLRMLSDIKGRDAAAAGARSRVRLG
ncbi:carbon-nitrogen hydrolase family protein [Kitasatospora sp. NBC_01266]|uniref:carbon-nitrogen hydrolase family protein n=1 Tax=Kitasatospora sp. NBC_01266 TaxID=2903572 RepID=UPI002E33DCCF|nr:carbon-nitrogen hydrolase family protein [Kitasatospora sp. NBC_01266]